MTRRPSWYPVNPGELSTMPVALMQDGIVQQIILAKDLLPGQIGWLAVDLPEGSVKPMSLEEALAAADIGFG